MFCTKCGKPNNDGAGFCVSCGAPLAAAGNAGGSPDTGTMRGAAATVQRGVAGKNPTVALVISIFLGGLGGGQFYNSDWKKGLVMAGISVLLAVPTGGLSSFGVWIWSMVDAFQVASGKWPAW